MNCPFYGRALYLAPPIAQSPNPPFVLFDQGGNQCAMVMSRHAPCLMEVEGQVPDWQTCVLVRDARMECEP